MKVLELFSGTRSIGKAFEEKGHEVFSVDYCEEFAADLHDDIEFLTAEKVLKLFGKPDVIWASPDCTTYSVAAISHHRRKNEETGSLDAVSEYAQKCDRVNRNMLRLIEELQPKYWFIENPRGGFRKMDFIQGKPRHTVTYCQYETDKPVEDRRMKPTDIFTNHPDPQFKKPCKNGDACHARAPRGARTGTQGIKGAKDRSRIPVVLCRHVVAICDR